ncbi:Enoyl-[acyl-carrier-protein] reductase [NADH] FabI [Anatilimnocola aggregata]|uniref:Enoyl-[acyl-carrier-protein] reductase [NADH] n=1 Tax=Anatilimnocola aggregata TaxID=2528021 RepID=A0A517YM77_9BACT|nr:enoyl-ACP reductase [Anatilimnocola aggregata]QDU31324.1 Enoyl-[acyl-carrier-protein] reductase [NADH] FabI [Anatilimnocola aggregata]
MGMFDGKKGLILGVANDRSIAWYISKFIMEQGGVCGFTHLPDKADDERKKNRMRVQKCIDDFPQQAKFLVPLNVQSDENIAEVMALAQSEFGQIDFLLHSIAFATLDDLKKDTIETSREGFKLAMEISAYSLLAVCNAAKGILKPAKLSDKREVVESGAAVLTLTYYGGERIVPGYNVMGICKAALDSCMKYAAYDLGLHGIRVNALSAGPLKTLAGSAAGVGDMQTVYDQMSPLQRCVTHEEVGRTGAFLLSEMSEGITAETMHVDGGFSEMGSPGRMLDKYRSK